MIQLTQQQLITQVFHLFSDQSSGIGYINDSLYNGFHNYPSGAFVIIYTLCDG